MGILTRSVWLAGALMVTHATCSLADDSTTDPSVPKPGDLLLGDAGDACQMIVCLSDAVGKVTPECAPPLQRYFDMPSHKRPKFLELCPKDDN